MLTLITFSFFVFIVDLVGLKRTFSVLGLLLSAIAETIRETIRGILEIGL
jgi:hypothetical protein